MKIFSTTDITLNQIQAWATKFKADDFFINTTIPLLYKHSIEYGVNPTFVIAQSTVETGWGHFRGQVRKDQYNVCGIKNADNTAFHTFDTIEEGTLAHVHHICLYAKHKNFPLADSVDPKHFSSLYGVALTPKEICKVWTQEETYNTYYLRIMEMIDEMENIELLEENSKETELELVIKELASLKLEKSELEENMENLKVNLLVALENALKIIRG